MSKHLYLTEGVETQLSESCLYLEDDVLSEIWELASCSKPPTAWTLFADLYGDASFGPESAKLLAEECRRLATEADPVTAVWLMTIAAFAAAAGSHNKCILAVAD